MQNLFTSDYQSRNRNQIRYYRNAKLKSFEVMHISSFFKTNVSFTDIWADQRYNELQHKFNADQIQTQQKDSLAIEAQSQGKSGRS